MAIARGGEAAGGRPGAAHRIVEFRARGTRSTCSEHLAVRQQSRCEELPWLGETAGRCPNPGRWIIEFRACERVKITADAAGNEHFTVLQQRGRMRIASGREAASKLKLKWSSRTWLHEQQSPTQ